MNNVEFLNEQENFPTLYAEAESIKVQEPKISKRINDNKFLDKNYKTSKDSYEEVKESKTHVVSFFSGAGGLDIGAQLAKAKVISSHDFDEDSIKTLSQNDFFNHAQHNLGDIAQANGLDFKNIIDKNNPEKLIIIGGPPCQPFSKAGYWTTLKNRLSHNDPRNMIGNYFRMISEIQPDGFLLENVESILHPHNKLAVENIIETIDFLGYNFKMIRANAIEYGVPQKRKRVFFVCSKKIFRNEEPKKTHGIDLLPFESVQDWIGKFDSMEFFEKEELTNRGTYHSDLLDVPPGKNYIAITAAAGYPNPKFVAQKRFWNFLLKLHPDLPSWTIAAQPGPWVGPFHWNSRRLRIPEIAALQTFPENYHLAQEDQYKNKLEMQYHPY